MLTITSEEEAAFIRKLLEPSDSVWLDFENRNGVWVDKTGSTCAHLPWLYGMPESSGGFNAGFSSRGGIVAPSVWYRRFIIEFGDDARLAPYTIQSPMENRDAAALLQKKNAKLAVVTNEQFIWLEPKDNLPKEEFEIRQIKFGANTQLSPSDLRMFDKVRNITWIEISECNDSVLDILKYTPGLRVLVVRGGNCRWDALSELPADLPLEKLWLVDVNITAKQTQQLMRGNRLVEVHFESIDAGSALVELLVKHRKTLEHLYLVRTEGLGHADYEKLSALQRLTRLSLEETGMADVDVIPIGARVIVKCCVLRFRIRRQFHPA